MYGFWLFQANGDRDVDTKEGKVTASLGVLTHYNMLLTEAIYELLADKGNCLQGRGNGASTKAQRGTIVHFRRVQTGAVIGGRPYLLLI
jgi:hypothetical protein